MDMELTSEKPIIYNFISLDQIPSGPGYKLTLSCDKNISQMEHSTLRWGDEQPMPSAVYVQGNTVHWNETLDNRILYHESYDIDTNTPAYWTLQHENCPVSISEKIDFIPSMIIVRAVEHCICAELYQTIQLEPGETSCWQRKWTFDKNTSHTFK